MTDCTVWYGTIGKNGSRALNVPVSSADAKDESARVNSYNTRAHKEMRYPNVT